MYINYSNNNNSKIIMVIIIITQYSKFQFQIFFSKLIGFLKKSTSLNTRLAAKTHLAVGEFSLAAQNKEWFLKLYKGTLIPVACKRTGNILDKNLKIFFYHTSVTELPVVRHRCLPCNRNHSIHTHVHRYQISNLSIAEQTHTSASQVDSAQNSGYGLNIVSPSRVGLLPGVYNCCTEE
jgi:hypothetical protein